MQVGLFGGGVDKSNVDGWRGPKPGSSRNITHAHKHTAGVMVRV